MGVRWAVPGVPAAGHVTARSFWHPGRPEGCPKCIAPTVHPACGRSQDDHVRPCLHHNEPNDPSERPCMFVPGVGWRVCP